MLKTLFLFLYWRTFKDNKKVWREMSLIYAKNVSHLGEIIGDIVPHKYPVIRSRSPMTRSRNYESEIDNFFSLVR